MVPTICRLGPFSLSSYGLLMAIGFLLASWLAARAARALDGAVPMPAAMVMDWACWGIVGGILGGRLLYLAQNWQLYLEQPAEIIALWHGGLIWYGGFFGGLIASVIFWRRHRIPVLRALDQVFPFVALGHAVGRIGCFLNGCCLGKPGEGWWAVQFPELPQPVIATQLLEAAGLALLYAALRMAQRPRVLAAPGRVFGGYLLGYGLLRWWIERLRDLQPLVWDGWTLHQLISAALILFGIGLLLRPVGAPAPPRPRR
jgi:phosphatidylglycerol:prolipoprotein diacylglycerol transferase